MNSTDRNLLYGIVAMQMNYVSRDDLISALNDWATDKNASLSDILQKRAALTADDASVVDTWIADQLRPTPANGSDDVTQHFDADRLRPPPANGSNDDVTQRFTAPGDENSPTIGLDFDRSRSIDDITVGLDELQSSDPPAAGLRVSSRFRVIAPHARGGLGEVFVAEDLELRRRVALKEIQQRFSGDKNSRDRFLQEAELTGRLEHPNIVPVYGLGAYPDGRPYYAMRFIKGDSLKDAVARYHEDKTSSPGERNLVFRNLLKRFIDVCNAVGYAHERGILHRDLKPSNVMLGEFGETLVVDWGLAKTIGGVETTDRDSLATADLNIKPGSGTGFIETIMGTALGTPAFMSPEQAAGRLDVLGKASDVFSLGATLYAILTGKAPYEADLIKMLRLAREADFKPPREVKPDVPAALDAVVRKAMAKKPEDRHSTALALAAEIESYLADEPVASHSESLAERARRWTRKHPRLVAGLATALIVGVVGLVVGLGLVNGEKNRTLEQKRIAEGNAQIAVEEARIAQAVRDFLQNKLLAQSDARTQANSLLAAGGSSSGAKLNPTVRELLDRASWQLEPERIDQHFSDHRPLQAELLTTVGAAYRGIGEFESAITALHRAVKLRKADLGADHPVVLGTQHDLATAYLGAGRGGEAIDLLQKIRAVQEQWPGPDHPDTLRTLNSLAVACAENGRGDEAIELLEKVRDAEARVLGVEHADTLVTLQNLAAAYGEARRHAEAITILEQVRDIKTRIQGADDPDSLVALQNLGSAFASVGKSVEAIAILERVRDKQLKILDPDHRDLLSTLHNLAVVYRDVQRRGDAIDLFEKVRAAQGRKLGPDHRDTLLTMHNLALAQRSAGKVPEAIELLKQVAASRKKTLGAENSETLKTLHHLATTYRAAGRIPEAIPLFEQVAAARKNAVGPDGRETWEALNHLAEACLRGGQAAKGILLLEQIRDAQTKKLGPDHADLIPTIANLAGGYMFADQAAKAIPLFERLLEVQTAKSSPEHPEVLQTLNNLAEAQVMVGAEVKAIPLFERLLVAQTKQLGADSLDVLMTVANLGAAKAACGNDAESLAHFVRAAIGMEKRGFKDDAAGLVVSSAAGACEKVKKFEDAESWRRKLLAVVKERSGPSSPEFADELEAMGANLLQQKKWSAAEKTLRDCLAIRGKVEPEGLAAANARSRLGAALVGLKRYPEAEPLLVGAFESMKKNAAKFKPEDRHRLLDAVDRVVSFYDVAAKPAELAKWRKERDRFAAEKPPADTSAKK
ncbi:MAG TPA: tetratricopeptide repeat protein [Planctomycetia bacterium]|nr:tetratricopeptide repeat protein [Planctomycetia bacterium]